MGAISSQEGPHLPIPAATLLHAREQQKTGSLMVQYSSSQPECRPLVCVGGEDVNPFHRGHTRYFAQKMLTLWFITVAKLQLRSSRETNFMMGRAPRHEEPYLKGHSDRRVENHWRSILKKAGVESARTQTFIIERPGVNDS